MDIGQIYLSLITAIPSNCIYTFCPKGDKTDHGCWCWNVLESSRRILILICIYLDSELCQVEAVAWQEKDKILWEGLFDERQCVAMAVLIMPDISLCWYNDILRCQVFWVLILIANVLRPVSITQYYYVSAVGGKSARLDKVTGLTTTNFAHVAINSRCSQ